MRDGEGNFVDASFIRDSVLDSFLMSSPTLRYGNGNLRQMPESRRVVLRYFIANPGKSSRACADYLGLSSVDDKTSNFVAIKYLETVSRSKGLFEHAALKITSAGIEACNRETTEREVFEAKYEPYRPESNPAARIGAEDGRKIKSRGFF